MTREENRKELQRYEQWQYAQERANREWLRSFKTFMKVVTWVGIIVGFVISIVLLITGQLWAVIALIGAIGAVVCECLRERWENSTSLTSEQRRTRLRVLNDVNAVHVYGDLNLPPATLALNFLAGTKSAGASINPAIGRAGLSWSSPTGGGCFAGVSPTSVRSIRTAKRSALPSDP